MAVSDIIVLAFGSVFLISNVVLSLQQHFNHSIYQVVCKVNYFTITWSYITSSQSFTAISIDRFLIMTYTNRKSPFQSKKILIMAITIIWIVGLLLAIPMLILADINPKLPHMCDLLPYGKNNDYTFSVYHLFALSVAFPIPLVTVFCLYFKVIRRISNSINNISNIRNRYDRNKRRQVHSTKMMILATLLFMVNSLPIMFGWFIALITGKSYVYLVLDYGEFIFILVSTAFFMASLTAIQNPFIFIIYNKTFRKAMISNFYLERQNKTAVIVVTHKSNNANT
ncbi:uncharacterized protein TRIADDRAFT_62369 [Trichoplax adhaerens]|uniref:G-protein coupled receptors family 1 profile domain-containing protein n=1 Tax=Trichoplax adhaerens TaxID=10228 RepID=B3SDL0_TRIAD|nr:hypothetical protein TRIADDRAFT_62369 [Trichoplax adhaerens]EDV19180.1 hypothetical protein TRIADDRAFT_62369 [Trichoplax adhaerens]|eukprot:XP_002118329.1 hypothetical protein TRIADDRAFT_62369 [Trichoplax adhaerens]